MCQYVYVYIYVYTCKYVYICVCIHMCMYKYVYVYIYVYIRIVHWIARVDIEKISHNQNEEQFDIYTYISKYE